MRIDRRRAMMAALALVPVACRRSEIDLRPTIEEPPLLASVVRVNDPEEATQLLRGFYPLEQNGWRWTSSSFAVSLRPPAGSVRRGARLMLHFTLPEVILNRVHTVTLTSHIGSLALPAETFKTAGAQIYSEPVPGVALAGGSVVAQFQVDHFLPAGTVEVRELAIIVTRVELQRL
jgi:hypothetical protein